MTSNFSSNANTVLYTPLHVFGSFSRSSLAKEMIWDSILLLLPCRHSWLELFSVTKHRQENQTVFKDIKRVWTPCICNRSKWWFDWTVHSLHVQMQKNRHTRVHTVHTVYLNDHIMTLTDCTNPTFLSQSPIINPLSPDSLLHMWSLLPLRKMKWRSRGEINYDVPENNVSTSRKSHDITTALWGRFEW